MITIDQLSYHSRLRYINTGLKSAFAITTLLICVVSRSIAVAAFVLISMGILSVCKGGIPFFTYLRYMMAPLTFLMLSTFAILFHLQQEPMDLFAFPIGSYYFTTSSYSLHYGLNLIITALACVSCLYFLSFHTPMPDLITFLTSIHFPLILTELMILIYRYIFILLNTASSITTSQNSRLGNHTFKISIKSFSLMASVLFIHSFKRANALYNAMESRCYDGVLHVLTDHYPVKPLHITFVIFYDIILIGIWLL